MAKLKDGTRVYGDAKVDQTLTVGNIAITGNLIVQGTTTSIDTTVTRVEDPIFELGGGANGAALTTNDAKERGILMHYFDGGAAVDAFMGWHTSNGQFEFGSAATETSGNIVVGTYGNIKAGVFFGDGGGLSNINGGNVNGDVAAANYANYAGTVTGSAQSNITSVGTLTGLTVGNSTANTVFGNGTITATGNINTGSSIIANGATSQFILGTSANTAVANIYGNLNVTGTITGTLDATIGAKGPSNAVQFNDAGNVNGTAGLEFAKSSNTLTVGANITLSSDFGYANIGGNINLGGSIVDTNSNGIELYSDDSAKLNYSDNAHVTVNSTGVLITAGDYRANLYTGNGQFAITDTFSAVGGDFTINSDANVNAAGYGSFSELYITDAIGSDGQINYINGTDGAIAGDSNFTYSAGTLYAPNTEISGNANIQGNITTKFAGGSSGNLLTTDTSGNIVTSNISFGSDLLTVGNANVVNNLTAGNLQVTGLGTTGALLYTSDIGGNVTESSTLTYTSGTLHTANLTASGNILGNTVSANNFSNTQIAFANIDHTLVGDASFTYNSGTSTLAANSVVVSTSLTGAKVSANNLSSTQIAYANIDHTLVGDSSFTYNDGTSTLAANSVVASTGVTAAKVTANNISDTSVPFANVDHTLISDSSFTYNSGTSTLAANNFTATVNVTAGNVYANSGTVKATTLIGTLDSTSSNQANITNVGTLGNLAVSGNANVGGLLTDNLYYSNGQPWDLQQAAGSNTEIQFNTNDNFDSSANFTFNPTSSLFTVTGNANVTGKITTSTANVDNTLYFGEGSQLYDDGGLNISGNTGVGIYAGGTTNNVSISTNDYTVTLDHTGNLTFDGEVSTLGNVAKANIANISTRVITPTVESPDSVDLTLTVNSAHTNGNIVLAPGASGVVEVSGAKITGLAEPTADNHAATKGYVDHVAQGLHVHGPAAVATTANLAGYNGTSHIFSGLSSLIIDGYTVLDMDRVLVKNQVTQSQNGIYDYDAGAGTLTRSADSNSAAEFAGGDFCFVINGDTQGDTGWVQTEVVTTLNSDNIIFQQFSGAGSYTANENYGMKLDGTVFRTKIDAYVAADIANNVPAMGTMTYKNGNIAVDDNAVFISPNIGNATGYSLELTGNLVALNANFGGTVFSNGNITLGAGSFVNGDVHGNISGNIKVSGSNGSLQFAANVMNHSGTYYGDLANDGANLTYVGGVLTVNVGNGGNVVTDHLTGTIETSSQPNITSVGTLDYLNVSTAGSGNGYVTATQVNTDNLYKADGTTPWDFAMAAGSTGQIQFHGAGADLDASANLSFDTGTNNLTVNGNIITGTGSGGNISGANVISATTVSATGDVSGGTLTGNLTTANQSNITTVGTLLSLTVANGGGGNILADNIAVVSGGQIGLSTSYLYGDGSNITGVTATSIDAGNLTGTTLSSNVLYSSLTSVGTLSSLEVTNDIVSDMGSVHANSGMVSAAYLYGDGSNISSITGANVTGYVENANIANIAYAVDAGNITGTTLASGVTGSSLTSVGTLGSLTVTNDITSTSGAILAANIGNSSTYLHGDGSNITGVTASSMDAGNLTGSTLSSNVTSSSLTSVGTLNGLTATNTIDFTGASNVALGDIGNVHVGGGTSGQYLQTNGSGSLTWSTIDLSMIDNGTSNVAVALNGNVTIAVAGATIITVDGNGANVTGIITATGNITGDNIISNNYVIANSTDDATDAITGAITTPGGISAQGNIYTGDALGFAHGSGNTDSAAYIKYNATAGSIDFIFN